MIKLIAVCVPWLMIFIGLGIYYRLARTESLNTTISALLSNSWLKKMIPVWLPQGSWGRFLLISTASSILFWPVKNLHVRRGMLAPDDVANSPKHIKLQLIIGSHFMYLGAALLFAAFTYYR